VTQAKDNIAKGIAGAFNGFVDEFFTRVEDEGE